MRQLWMRRLGIAVVCLIVPIGLWVTIVQVTNDPVDSHANQLPSSRPPGKATAVPSDVTASQRPETVTPSDRASTPSTTPSRTPVSRTSNRPTAPRPASTRPPQSATTERPTSAPTTSQPGSTPAAPSSEASTATATPSENTPTRTPTPTKTPTRTPSPSPTPPLDDSPPSQVTGLDVSTSDQRTYQLTWFPASDNIGVVEYEVDVNGTIHATTGTTYQGTVPVGGPGTLHLQVRAVDAANNKGRWSDPVTVEVVDPTPTPEPSPNSPESSPTGTLVNPDSTATTDRVGQPTP